MKVTPCIILNGSEKAEGVYGRSTLQPGAGQHSVPSWMPWGQPKEEDWTSKPRPHSWTQSQMSVYAGNFKMDLHLASLLESWHTSLWCYSFIALPHTRLPQSKINWKNSSKIALLVQCKCSSVSYKAHRAHLLPWIKGEAQTHFLAFSDRLLPSRGHSCSLCSNSTRPL